MHEIGGQLDKVLLASLWGFSLLASSLSPFHRRPCVPLISFVPFSPPFHSPPTTPRVTDKSPRPTVTPLDPRRCVYVCFSSEHPYHPPTIHRSYPSTYIYVRLSYIYIYIDICLRRYIVSLRSHHTPPLPPHFPPSARPSLLGENRLQDPEAKPSPPQPHSEIFFRHSPCVV